MEPITDPRNLTPAQIDYRIGGLREYHHVILSYLCQGKKEREIAELTRVKFATLKSRIGSACDHAGVRTVQSLIAMYAIWSYAKTMTKQY